MKNLISIRDLGREGIEEFLAEAEKMIPYIAERKIAWAYQPNRRQVPPEVFELFLEKSLRTWGSFATAAEFVGFRYRPILGEEQTSIPKGESFTNTLRMLVFQQQASILVLRTKWEGAPRFATEILKDLPVPVINGGDGCNRHPSQAHLDLFTIKRKLGRLTDFTLGFVGDMIHSRTAHDLLEAARIFGFRIALFCSPETRPPKSWLKGVEVVVESETLDGIEKCDIINVIRLQKERLEGDPLLFQRALERVRLTRRILDERCKKDVLIFHAQPIDKDWDILPIEPGIYEDLRIRVVHEQAEGGLPSRMADLRLLWRDREEPTRIPKVTPVRPEVIEEDTIEAHNRRLAEKRLQYFMPTNNGTIIDHLPPRSGQIALKMLERLGAIKSDDPVVPPRCVPSAKYGKKDVLILESRTQIPFHILGTIATFFPTITVNICHDSQFRKLKIPRPKMIPIVLPCPNPECITNNDPEAQTRFWSVAKGESEDSKDLLCDFCERTFTPEEILRKMTA